MSQVALIEKAMKLGDQLWSHGFDAIVENASEEEMADYQWAVDFIWEWIKNKAPVEFPVADMGNDSELAYEFEVCDETGIHDGYILGTVRILLRTNIEDEDRFVERIVEEIKGEYSTLFEKFHGLKVYIGDTDFRWINKQWDNYADFTIEHFGQGETYDEKYTLDARNYWHEDKPYIPDDP